MSASMDKPAPTLDEMRARVVAHRRQREEDETFRKAKAEFDRVELVERFEKELNGREGVTFSVFDATSWGEGFFVVRLGDPIHFKTFMDHDKRGEVERCDFVAPNIVHPSKEEYLAARGRRSGIDLELSNRLARLYGLDVDVDQGK